MQRLTEDKFVSDINENIGIIHKICNIYFTGELDRQDARQEILYQLWKSYTSYRGDSKFPTWMYKVALNTAIAHLKKSSKEPVKTMLPEQFGHLAESSDQQAAHEK